MTSLSPSSLSLRAPDLAPIPNNLGPTLLLAAGVLLLPILVGLPLLLLGLAGVRDAAGQRALPRLASVLQRVIG